MSEKNRCEFRRLFAVEDGIDCTTSGRDFASYYVPNSIQEACGGQNAFSRGSLEPRQIGFANELATALETCPWTADQIRVAIIAACQLTPIDPVSAVDSIHKILRIDSPDVCLEEFIEKKCRDDVVAKLASHRVRLSDFWQQTSISVEDFESWLEKNLADISAIHVFPKFQLISQDLENAEFDSFTCGMGVLEFRVTTISDRVTMKRVKFSSLKGFDTTSARELEYFQVYGSDYVHELVSRFGLPIKKEFAS